MNFLKNLKSRASQKTEKVNGSATTEKCVGMNIGVYYEEFVEAYGKVSYPQVEAPDVQKLLECFEEYLEKQEGRSLDSIDEYTFPARRIEEAIVGLAKALLSECLEMNPEIFYECDDCEREDESKLCDDLLVLERELALVVLALTEKYSRLSYCDIMGQIIESADYVADTPWSFDSFKDAIHFANNDAMLVNAIDDVWYEKFEYFMQYADRHSLAVLKHGCRLNIENPVDQEWCDELYDYIQNCIEEHCPHFLMNIVAKMFPEMLDEILEGMLLATLDEGYNKIAIGNLLCEMAVYQEYMLHNFKSCALRFKDIIRYVMRKDLIDSQMGAELNEVCEHITNTFKIPEECVEACIRQITLERLGYKDDGTRVVPGPLDLLSLMSLLPNKTVFEIVDEYNPAIIDQFS